MPFRHRSLRSLEQGAPPPARSLLDDLAEKRRRSAKISRRLRILRAHGIINKRPQSYRYDVTAKGRDINAAVLAASNATVEQLKQCAWFLVPPRRI